LNRIVKRRLAALWPVAGASDILRVLMATPRAAGLKACTTYGWIASVVALSAVTAACASSGAVPRPFPTPGSAAAPTTSAPNPATEPSEPTDTTIVGTALSFRGVPYRNGGSDPTGFDCSGFTQYVFAQHGIALPRETREQFQMGEKIS